MKIFTITDHVLFADGVQVQELPKLAKAATVRVWAVPAAYIASGYFVDTHVAGAPQGVPACDPTNAVHVATLELAADDSAMATEARAERLQQVNADADILLAELDNSYPEREVLTWDQQLREAEALQDDLEATTPLLSALATYRDIDVGLLASKVLEKSLLYKVASGQIMGGRQWVEQSLEAAQTHADVLAVPTLGDRLLEVETA